MSDETSAVYKTRLKSQFSLQTNDAPMEIKASTWKEKAQRQAIMGHSATKPMATWASEWNEREKKMPALD